MDSSFIKSYCNITSELLKYNIKYIKDENIVISPHSYIELMNILFEGSDNNTMSEIVKSFGFDNKSALSLKNSIKETRDVFKKCKEFTSTNALFTKVFKKEDFKKEFLKTLKNSNCETFCSKNLIKDVNAWVNRKTKGNIKDLSININDNAIISLLNVSAFDAKWEEKYRDSDILEDVEFKNIDNTKTKVSYLKSQEKVYLENSYITGFIKPYKNNNYSFAGLLPKKDGRKELEKAVEHLDLYKLLDKNEICNVDAFIPRFENKYQINLNDFCKSMGITEMFTDKADFSNMILKSVFISCIDQETYIKVDEKGTKAASVSMAQFLFTGAHHFKERKQVFLNRPFIYAIIHNDTRLPVFVGIMKNMEKNQKI